MTGRGTIIIAGTIVLLALAALVGTARYFSSQRNLITANHEACMAAAQNYGPGPYGGGSRSPEEAFAAAYAIFKANKNLPDDAWIRIKLQEDNKLPKVLVCKGKASVKILNFLPEIEIFSTDIAGVG